MFSLSLLPQPHSTHACRRTHVIYMSLLPFWLLRQVGDGALARNVFAQLERVEQYVEEKCGAIYALPTVWLEEFELVHYGPRAVHLRIPRTQVS